MKATPHRLVLEDQVVIGMAIEADLEEVGMQIAGPSASCEKALAWADNETPDVAFLDFKLKDGPCTELTCTLLQRGVPVVIYSGIPQGADTPPELRKVTRLEKPVDRAKLLDVLVGAAARKPVLCD